MEYCVNCGKSIKPGHRFCPVCGTPRNPLETAGNNTSYRSVPNTGIRENDKALAIISYIGVLSVVSYFVTPKTPSFARFHAIQGINLFIIECIVGIASPMLSWIFHWAWPVTALFSFIFGIAGLGILALSILGIVNAVKGVTAELPVVGQIKIIKE